MRSSRKSSISRSKPEGRAVARSRAIVAPGGSGVSGRMPTRAKAALLRTQAWPERWLRRTGLSGAAASRSRRVGWRFSARWKSLYPVARIHSPGGVWAARRRMARAMSGMDETARGLQSTAKRLAA